MLLDAGGRFERPPGGDGQPRLSERLECRIALLPGESPVAGGEGDPGVQIAADRDEAPLRAPARPLHQLAGMLPRTLEIALLEPTLGEPLLKRQWNEGADPLVALPVSLRFTPGSPQSGKLNTRHGYSNFEA